MTNEQKTPEALPHNIHTSCNNRIKQEGFQARCCHCFPHADCKYYPNATPETLTQSEK
ncbi:MAG: hypothetical protein M0P64_03095 [Candidatus Pacebacteria bacterium]|nr:hypothetical protein [Candidatus Paceibacterota bacterium]